jgi:hypothetical protein
VYSPKFTDEIQRAFASTEVNLADGTIETAVSVTVSNSLPVASATCAQPALPPNPPCYWFRWWLAFDREVQIASTPVGRNLPGSLAASQGMRTDAVSCCTVESDDERTLVSGMDVVPPGGSVRIELALRYRR